MLFQLTSTMRSLIIEKGNIYGHIRCFIQQLIFLFLKGGLL